MNRIQPPHRRALVALVPAALLLAAPALAQDAAAPPVPAPPAVAPAPPAPTLPPAPAPAAGPQPLTNGVAARNGIGDPNSSTPIAPEAIAQAEEARAARAAEARSAPRATTSRTVPRATTSRIAPRAASQRTAPARTAAAPVAGAPTRATPVPAATAAAPASPDAAAPDAAATTTPADGTRANTTATGARTATGTPVWPWIVGALVVLVGLLAFFLRRRDRADPAGDVYEDPAYQEPVARTAAEPAVIAPVAAAPIVAAPVVAAPAAAVPVVGQRQAQGQTQGTRLEPQFLHAAPVAAAVGAAALQADAVAVEAELAEPEAEDVAALTAGSGHGNRPWLEFSLRPVRAGSNADDALVEIELTVGNSGTVAAEDVRISTLMFADGSTTPGEMDRLLAARAADSEVSPVTIPAGEGTRVDATLTLSKEHLGDAGQAFNPVIVADARYRLADGSEGRTSASFTIGRIADAGEDMGGIAIHRQQMSDDIEARLHGVPAHA